MRHVSAILVSAVLNLGLLVCLGWWSAASQHPAEPVFQTVPLQVVDTAREPPQVKATERVEVMAVPVSEPVLARLPLPQLARLPALRPAAPAEGQATLGLPPFNPQRIQGFSGAFATPSGPDRNDQSWGNTRAAVLVRPADLALYYPYAARLKEITGITRVRLRVGADGRVTEADVLSGDPPGIFESAARRVAHSLRFQPALKQGRPVSSEVTIAIEWRLPE